MNRRVLITAIVLVGLFGVPTFSKSSSTAKNHDLLTKLGMQRIRGPNSHHRKRLAVESRHHSRSDDSHMFIIKLPPNPHYYVHNKPPEDMQSKSKNLNVPFQNNGKPAKIYHWNIPVLKKMVKKYKGKSTGFNLDVAQPDSWNEVLDKPMKEKKPVKPSYYIPAKPKKSSFTKYFAGNGKPHSFYVIEKVGKLITIDYCHSDKKDERLYVQYKIFVLFRLRLF